LRYWFWFLLLAGLLLAWLRPEVLRAATDRLEPRAVIAVALLLMAVSLEGRSLYESLARPWPALWAVCLSYGLLPALGWLSGRLLAVPDLRVGLLLITSVPCTLASAVLWTRMAGGNDAVALLVVFFSTATSWLLTTAWLALGTGTAAAVDVPVMMGGLVVVLIMPVGIGQLARAVGPLARAADRHKAVLAVISRLLVLCIILRAAVGVRDKLAGGSVQAGVTPVLAMTALCLATHLLGLSAGFWSSRWLGFPRPNQIAVALSCSQKTLPVALYLFDVYFVADYPLAVLPLVVYHVGQLVADTAIADWWAKQGERRVDNGWPKPLLGI
jgi:sodium/bile acid cotransporter 7